MSWETHTPDVGQSDSRSLIAPDGQTVVIDADIDQVTKTLDTIEGKTIDHLIITHIHDDHVAGIPYLSDDGYTVNQAHQPTVSRYEVERKDGYVKPRLKDNYYKWLSSIGIESQEINHLAASEKIFNEEDATLRVLSPPASDETLKPTSQSSGHTCSFKPKKANGNGVVCKFEGPDGVSGLFMGDVGDESAHNAESWLTEQHANTESDVDLTADILYLGHHGSNKSTDETFLDAVDPEYVVISSSLDNNYTSKNQYDGHPHDKTLERLHERELDVHWTAVHGTIDTTVEDGTVTLDHDTAIETTNAADLAALKYYGRDNDLDQEALAEIEEITSEDLPEETPNWVDEVSLATKQPAIDPEKLEELTELEAEQSDLKQEKYRLEGDREQRLERKAALEQESENSQGLTDRLTEAVGSLWGAETDGDGTTQEDTTSDHRSAESAPTEQEGNGRPSRDPDTPTSETDGDSEDGDNADQDEHIDATIAAYERRNAALRAEITELTEQVEDLTTQIDTLEQELDSPGLLNRVTAAIGSEAGDSQQTEIRRERLSDTVSSPETTDTEATEDTATTEQEHAESTWDTLTQAQQTDHTSDQTRSESTHRDQDPSTDPSDDRGFSL